MSKPHLVAALRSQALRILSILAVVGCRQTSRVDDPDLSRADTLSHQHFHPILLRGTPAFSDSILGKPSHLAALAGTIWIADRAGEPFLHRASVATGRVIGSTGRFGDGPGDFASIQNLALRPGDSTALWAYDGRLGRITRVTDSGPDLHHVIQFASAARPLRVVWLNRDTLVGLGEMDTDRITFIDITGKSIGTLPAPLLGADSIPARVRSGPSTGVELCLSQGAGRFAELFIGAGRIDIFDRSGHAVAHANVPFPTNGAFERLNDGSWHAAFPHRRYYADCAATSTRLYALFSGHRTDATPGAGVSVAAAYVHLFDWTGRLKAVLQLDRDASAMTVAGDSLLYAAASGSGDIYVYRIPADIRAASHP